MAGFKPFETIIKLGAKAKLEDIKGICYFKNSEWIQNEREVFNVTELPFPNRSHFYKNSNKYRYVNMKPCAIVKASYSCPNNCNYCFSTLLNGGKYICREPENVVEEIKNIDCDSIWLVDDTFYVDKNKLERFIELIEQQNIKKNYALYFRVDFIANNPELMQRLANIGVKMCAVGLEVIDDEVLEKYNKKTNVNIMLQAIEVLKSVRHYLYWAIYDRH
ncbi:MAG: radical SAM protein [Oscillospiraceae bacterium]|nr:radical SAM protein [Oscillospiraceae bacterium]